MDTTVADTLVGRVLDGRYQIQERIARGGMATVYRALDTRLDRSVAVKVMHPALAEDPDFVSRFAREARAAAKLSHPNVVAVFDQGSDGGVVFLVMEYVDGATLREVIRDHGRLSPRQALDVVAPVLSALAAAHDAGIVHRDIKPENVLIAANGRVKVADFGLARAIAASQMTATTGLLIGTAAYLAPEQIEHGHADPRTDLYAAGIMLYELLVGKPPYSGATPMAVVFKHVHEQVPAPSLVRPEVPRAVDALVLDATQREPADRPPSAHELLGQLEAVARTLPPDPLDLTKPTVVLGEHVTTVLRDEHQPMRTLVDRGQPARTLSNPAQPARTLVSPAGRPPSLPVPAERGRREWLHGWRIAVILLVILTLLAGTAGAYIGLHDQLFGTAHAAGTPSTSSSPASSSAAASQVPTTLAAPKFTGLTRDAADLLAQTENLTRPTYATDAQYSDLYPADQVMAQVPGEGEQMTSTTAIVLTLSKGPAPVDIPATIVGQSTDQASQILQAAKLKLGGHSSEYDTSVPEGDVLRITTQGPVAPGTAVQVVLSRGPKPIAVTDEKGKSPDAAAADLKTQGFTGDITQGQDYSDTVPKGDVISTSPPAGTAVGPATPIKLVVSLGPQLFKVPNLFGMTVTEAKNKLAQYGMTAQIKDLRNGSNEHVLSQSPSADLLRPSGTVVTIRIF